MATDGAERSIQPDGGEGDERQLFTGILWLNSKVLGLTLGLVSGLAIFFATNWLVIKGGEGVGSHLRLLANYFIGYRVSFFGSLVGFAYGLALGTLSGALIGWIYNGVTVLIHGRR